jgi:transcriptional regulator with XRE-family HTH domain
MTSEVIAHGAGPPQNRGTEPDVPTPLETTPFARMLRDWRRQRRRSQLALSLDAGVSQRHLSWLESGRAQPSAEMVLQLAGALDVPLRARNDLLVAAGYAPRFPARPMDAPEMAQVLSAVRRMLQNHAPYPALAADRAWNVRLTNPPFDRFEALFGADLWTRVASPERNLMRMFFHPAGIRPCVRNWSVVAPLLWQRARREADALGGEDLGALLTELAPYQDAATLQGAEGVALWPVLPLELEVAGLRASLFTVISTFGTPQDVTADELRIESFFPADDATERLFQTGG